MDKIIRLRRNYDRKRTNFYNRSVGNIDFIMARNNYKSEVK